MKKKNGPLRLRQFGRATFVDLAFIFGTASEMSNAGAAEKDQI